jgi:hypothetical protein
LKTIDYNISKNIKNKDICEIYIKLKAIAKNSYKPIPIVLNYLEKVYLDIYGPILSKTYDKKRYFISFIDDKTRYVDIVLLRTRDELFNTFTKWLNTQEN